MLGWTQHYCWRYVGKRLWWYVETALVMFVIYCSGECCRTENCDSAAFSPVCDSLGTTHANECLMHRSACIQLKKYQKSIQVAYQVSLITVPITVFDRVWQSFWLKLEHKLCCSESMFLFRDNVAINLVMKIMLQFVTAKRLMRTFASSGSGYHRNIGTRAEPFRIAQCEADRLNQTINIVYPGECCVVPGGECETSGPVCDSEGQTHSNHCLYQQKRCMAQRKTKKTLNIVHTGERKNSKKLISDNLQESVVP